MTPLVQPQAESEHQEIKPLARKEEDIIPFPSRQAQKQGENFFEKEKCDSVLSKEDIKSLFKNRWATEVALRTLTDKANHEMHKLRLDGFKKTQNDYGIPEETYEKYRNEVSGIID
jgi:hypothetical protein